MSSVIISISELRDYSVSIDPLFEEGVFSDYEIICSGGISILLETEGSLVSTDLVFDDSLLIRVVHFIVAKEILISFFRVFSPNEACLNCFSVKHELI